MTTLMEAETVEVGALYILHHPKWNDKYQCVSIYTWPDDPDRIMFRDAGIELEQGQRWFDYQQAVKDGAKFFGPLELNEENNGK